MALISQELKAVGEANASSGGLVDIDSLSASIAGCARKHGRTAGIPSDLFVKAAISERERQARICPDVELRFILTERIWAMRRTLKRSRIQERLDFMTKTGRAT